jgi:hypothetical protein
VFLGGWLVQEQAGGFDHHIGMHLVPFQRSRVTLLGQADFFSGSSGTSISKLRYQTGVFVSNDGRLIVSDRGNQRVLIWSSIPTVINTPANVVIGQPNFNTNAFGNAANSFPFRFCSSSSHHDAESKPSFDTCDHCALSESAHDLNKTNIEPAALCSLFSSLIERKTRISRFKNLAPD